MCVGDGLGEPSTCQQHMAEWYSDSPRCVKGVTAVSLFSGGVASWGAARRYADQHGTEGLVLLFTDTRTEDADLYRFLEEAAADIGAPLVKLADGRDIWQVFRDERMLGNTRADPCSRVLKRDLSAKWLEKNAPDATLIFGYDWTEVHRHERSVLRWAPRPVASPLIDPPLRLKTELLADLESRGIEPPRLTAMGFPHNNCGGGCVKAGQGHFLKLLEELPDVYADWERHEEELRGQLGNVAILRDRTGGTTTPLPLRELRERQARGGIQIDVLEVGGCACFEEPEAA